MEIRGLLNDQTTKIVLLVFDGLGGTPFPGRGVTELEAAHIPNMDALAEKSARGLMVMVDYGIAPGSGPGHFALFGYDPVKTEVGRGVLEALGVGHVLTSDELAARGNFATKDPKTNNIIDRRGGIPTQERNRYLCQLLNEKVRAPENYGFKVISGKEHRFVFILKGPNLADRLTETDPQITGVPALKVQPLHENSVHTARIVNEVIAEMEKVLASETPQNTILLRGFATPPKIEPFPEKYGLRSAAIATYPMYKGIAKLVGMDVLETGSNFGDQVATLKDAWDQYDFFFIHVKGTDSAGHAGDFDKKVHVLEECDKLIPSILSLKPDVFIITGDHSTPCALKEHSFHPVPVLIHAQTAIPTPEKRFTEASCAHGILGVFPGQSLMPIALGYANRLKKFGA